MPRFTFNKEDLLRGKVVDGAAWFNLEITGIEVKPAKSDPSSENTTVKFKIVGGPYDGVPVQRLYSEKAIGFMKPLVEALIGKELKAGDAFDLDDKQVGKQVQGYIKPNVTTNNTPFNDVQDFKALKKG